MTEEIDKLKKELSDPTSEITIINTPTAQVKKLEAQLEEMTTKAEDYELKLKLIGEKKLEERLNQLNVSEYDRDYFRANPDKLKAFEMGKQNQGTSGRGNIGLRPEDLAREQNHGNSGSKSYPSHEALVKDVCQKASQGDPEMQEVKKKLWEKMIHGWKEAPNQTMNQTHEYPDFLKDALEAQNRKWKKGFEGRKESE